MDGDVNPLETRLDALVAKCGFNPAFNETLFKTLVTVYTEPQRHYHTLSHLTHMFAKQDEAGLNDAASQWATWFHDAVYVPSKSNNEPLSAELASEHLKVMGAEPSLIERTKALILCTQNHDCGAEDQIAHLFLDSDMAILGETPPLYAIYLKGIRREFSQIPRFLFNRGRKKFLRDILHRDHIFLSDHFRTTYEESARRNLTDELNGQL